MNPELAVEERLRRLESQVRRARMWSVGTTVALGAVVFASMQAPQAKELIVDSVTARTFRVVDTAGELHGEFGTENGQPNNVLLRLSAGSGAERATSTLRVRPKDASLQLSGDDRESLAWMWSGHGVAHMDLCSRSELTEPGAQSVASMVGSPLGGRLHLGRVSAKGPNGTEPPEVAPVDGSDVVKVPESSRAWRYSPQVTLDAANGYHLEAKQ